MHGIVIVAAASRWPFRRPLNNDNGRVEHVDLYKFYTAQDNLVSGKVSDAENKKENKMKKLMIVAAVALATCFANAANCNWSTTAVTADMTGMIDGGTYWLVALGADTGASSAFKVNSDGTYDFGSYSVVDTGAVNSGAAGGMITGLTAADNSTYYALIIWDGVEGVDGTTGKGYFGVAEGSLAGISDSPPMDADPIPFDNLGYGGYMATTTHTVPVSGPVPEPTSGLLLLLGMAGLALKRKRA